MRRWLRKLQFISGPKALTETSLDRDGNLIYKYTPPEVKMAGPNGEVIDLMVFPNSPYSFVKYQGGPNLQFFKEIKVEGQADVQRQVIGQVQLPVATQSALLLFYPRDQAMSSSTSIHC